MKFSDNFQTLFERITNGTADITITPREKIAFEFPVIVFEHHRETFFVCRVAVYITHNLMLNAGKMISICFENVQFDVVHADNSID